MAFGSRIQRDCAAPEGPRSSPRPRSSKRLHGHCLIVSPNPTSGNARYRKTLQPIAECAAKTRAMGSCMAHQPCRLLIRATSVLVVGRSLSSPLLSRSAYLSQSRLEADARARASDASQDIAPRTATARTRSPRPVRLVPATGVHTTMRNGLGSRLPASASSAPTGLMRRASRSKNPHGPHVHPGMAVEPADAA